MLRTILPEIWEPDDYVRALELFKTLNEPPVTPPTEDQVSELLEIYTKYLSNHYDPKSAKLYLATGLLFENGEEYMAVLNLPEQDSSTLLKLKEMIDRERKDEPTEEYGNEILAIVKSGDADEMLRAILAREAIDMMARSRNYQILRGQILELADFLIGCSAEVMDRATRTLREVKYLCKEM